MRQHRHGLDVEIEQPLEVLPVVLRERARQADAGIVDQDVRIASSRAPVRLDVASALPASVISRASVAHLGVPKSSAQLRGEGRHLSWLRAMQQQVRAFALHSVGRRPPDALRAPCDDGDRLQGRRTAPDSSSALIVIGIVPGIMALSRRTRGAAIFVAYLAPGARDKHAHRTRACKKKRGYEWPSMLWSSRRELIRFDTINPPGREQAAAEHLACACWKAPVSLATTCRSRRWPAQSCCPHRRQLAPSRLWLSPAIPTPSARPAALDRLLRIAADVKDGRVWGRGASDMKAGVAAFVAAAIDSRRGSPARRASSSTSRRARKPAARAPSCSPAAA